MCHDFFDGIDEWDWAIIGPLSEEMEDERNQRRQWEDDMDKDDEERW